MMLLLALIAVSSVYGTTCDGLAHVAAKANAVSAQIVSNNFFTKRNANLNLQKKLRFVQTCLFTWISRLPLSMQHVHLLVF